MGLAGAAMVWPASVAAQQRSVAVIGFLNAGSPETSADQVDAFRKGLAQMGYVEGKNLAIEFRWAEGDYDRLPLLAAELVRQGVAVIAATGGSAPAGAAKSATAAIPIVFTGGGDPIELGLVSSLSRPEANVTGATNVSTRLGSKRFGLLHELLPHASPIGFLVDSRAPSSEAEIADTEQAARGVGHPIQVVTASSDRDFEPAFASLARDRAGGALVGSSAVFTRGRVQLVALAARHKIPTIYSFREFTAAGGLMSYGPSIAEGYYQAGLYTGKILRGAKPADLPLVQSAKFELVINLTTAKALGLSVPPSLLARADEVIE
jgi:putative ABC transport system substrate-binding protein